ncbi:MAG TPA: hypothetical protein VGI39_34515 [Polyangiaceae bacterium]
MSAERVRLRDGLLRLLVEREQVVELHARAARHPSGDRARPGVRNEPWWCGDAAPAADARACVLVRDEEHELVGLGRLK